MTDTVDIQNKLAACRLIPVVSLPDAELAEPLADALVQAGLPCIEVTFRTPAAAAALAKLARRTDLLVAAGTVMSIEQAKQARDAGAACLLSPGTDAAVIQWCNDNALLMIPGVATPSEIIAAQQLGLSLLKFFPAEINGGADALKALAGPFQDVQFIPTGGITQDNLQTYLSLPNVLACGGSWMVRQDWLKNHDFAQIRKSVSDVTALLNTPT